MVFTDDFSDMCVQSLTWYPLTIRDSYSVPTYGSGTVFKCRIEKRNRITRDIHGKEIVSSANAIILGHPVISPQDKVTLDDGSSPQIISVAQVPDENGPCYTKVYFL